VLFHGARRALMAILMFSTRAGSLERIPSTRQLFFRDA
jgi:hypothetical protein